MTDIETAPTPIDPAVFGWPEWPLSEWHPIPARTPIPEGARYAILYPDGSVSIFVALTARTPSESARHRYRTEQRIPEPLPTAEGARIVVQLRAFPAFHELTRVETVWRRADGAVFLHDEIVRWAPIGEWVES